MLALAVRPSVADSLHVRQIEEPQLEDGDVLAEVLAIGICGTDREIGAGEYGSAPGLDDYLVLGHESLCRVLKAPPSSGFSPGDLVVPMVRQPDPLPCAACARGEWDMCQNGGFREHGIKELHGFGTERVALPAERWVAVPKQLGLCGVLVEPTSIVAKAWEHTAYLGERSIWTPHRVVVTGAGPIGLLAALLSVQRGFDTHVYDRSEPGLKSDLVTALGATFHSAHHTDMNVVLRGADVIIETTGAAQVILQSMEATGPGGVVCLTGVSQGKKLCTDIGGLNRSMVLDNNVVFGSVNANKRHYQRAVEALVQADLRWLQQLITKQAPLAEYAQVWEREQDDVKTVLRITEM